MTIFQHTWEWLFAPSPHTGDLKTETRRLVKSGEFAAYSNKTGDDWESIAWVSSGKRFIYRSGSTYTVQPGRGKRAIWFCKNAAGVHIADTSKANEREIELLKGAGFRQARFKLLSLRREDVRAISAESARREGFRHPLHFLKQWVEMHDPQVKIVDFQPTSGSEFCYIGGLKSEWKQGLTWGEGEFLMRGLQTRPADRYQAWVLKFTPPVLLEE